MVAFTFMKELSHTIEEVTFFKENIIWNFKIIYKIIFLGYEKQDLNK